MGNSKPKAPVRVEGTVEISIAAGKPNRRRGHAGNLPKAVQDLLIAHGVVEDDAQVMCITSGWDVTIPPSTVGVTMQAAKAYVNVWGQSCRASAASPKKVARQP